MRGIVQSDFFYIDFEDNGAIIDSFQKHDWYFNEPLGNKKDELCIKLIKDLDDKIIRYSASSGMFDEYQSDSISNPDRYWTREELDDAHRIFDQISKSQI